MSELRDIKWYWPLLGCLAQFGYCLNQEFPQTYRDFGSKLCSAIYGTGHQVFAPVKSLCCALSCWLGALQVESRRMFVRLLRAVLAESPTFNRHNLERSLSKHQEDS